VNPTFTFWRRLWGRMIFESSDFLCVLHTRSDPQC